MSFFDSIGQQSQQMPQQAQQMQQRMISDVKRDPHGAIKKAGYNVPDDMSDPMQMAKYLLDSNQITGPRAQMARQLMARMER